MYIEEGWGYKRICQELGIPCTKMIRLWVKRHHEHGRKGIERTARDIQVSIQGKTPKKECSLGEESRRLKTENDYLKKLRELARR